MDISGNTCELCTSPGGTVLWESPVCRVVRVADPYYPGFCRVIWTAHVREMSDLEAGERHSLMDVVFGVERVVRALFNPDKINLASFGNVVPHLHWHVIPRWSDDRHFPEPIWGAVHRETTSRAPLIDDAALSSALVKEFSPRLQSGMSQQ